jgi:hypothetical protein
VHDFNCLHHELGNGNYKNHECGSIPSLASPFVAHIFLVFEILPRLIWKKGLRKVKSNLNRSMRKSVFWGLEGMIIPDLID